MVARAVIVLAEGVQQLTPALTEANFFVVVARSSTSDLEVKTTLLPHRLLVTKSPKGFVADAPVYDYGIIDLSRLRHVSPEPSHARNRTTQLISRAVSDFDLVHDCRFVITLRQDGRHVYARVE